MKCCVRVSAVGLIKPFRQYPRRINRWSSRTPPVPLPLLTLAGAIFPYESQVEENQLLAPRLGLHENELEFQEGWQATEEAEAQKAQAPPLPQTSQARTNITRRSDACAGGQHRVTPKLRRFIQWARSACWRSLRCTSHPNSTAHKPTSQRGSSRWSMFNGAVAVVRTPGNRTLVGGAELGQVFWQAGLMTRWKNTIAADLSTTDVGRGAGRQYGTGSKHIRPLGAETSQRKSASLCCRLDTASDYLNVNVKRSFTYTVDVAAFLKRISKHDKSRST